MYFIHLFQEESLQVVPMEICNYMQVMDEQQKLLYCGWDSRPQEILTLRSEFMLNTGYILGN